MKEVASWGIVEDIIIQRECVDSTLIGGGVQRKDCSLLLDCDMGRLQEKESWADGEWHKPRERHCARTRAVVIGNPRRSIDCEESNG